MGGAVSIPGPPMLIYGTFMSTVGDWSGRKTKAIFTAFFGILQLYRTVVIAFQGKITFGILFEILIILPAMLIGMYIGLKIFDRFSNKIFDWVLVTALIINAVFLIGK